MTDTRNATQAWEREPARQLVHEASALRRSAEQVDSAVDGLTTQVRSAFEGSRREKVLKELRNYGVERLRGVTAERLRTTALEKAGYRTVADVLGANPRELLRRPGIGERTAAQSVAAARQIASVVSNSLNFRIDLDPKDPKATALLQAIHVLGEVQRYQDDHGTNAASFISESAHLEEAARSRVSAVRGFFSGKRRRAEADAALDALSTKLTRTRDSGLADTVRRVGQLLQAPAQPREVWADFEKHSARYYAILGQVVDLKLDVEAAEGHLPAELVEKINEQVLDYGSLKVSLRGYQEFGAKYALVQRTSIIGDEMGLGKTVEAIAAMAHLASAQSNRHFLVVCPASVLTNWSREVGQHSQLPVTAFTGPTRQRAFQTWMLRGGVGLITLDQLSRLQGVADISLAMLVIDEAHLIKNPQTKRGLAVADWCTRADRVLFMTGTPLENRVNEFASLINYLRPDVAGRINHAFAQFDPESFRRAIASVYLRRNQEDVLNELPELVQVDEWEEFGKTDRRAYRDAVHSGNFMRMRRAAFAVSLPGSSAKLDRLSELVEEAADNDRKVVVFSYFRDVLDVVHSRLGAIAVGPLTGSVSAGKRQQLIDEFSDDMKPRVLVSQIQAGGVGVNIQAASVVILCEPQVKPTLETQAIARTHRMGQVRNVQVHRLLTTNSVDQRMVEMLNTKTAVFNEYARRSAVAEATPAAVDVSEAELAHTIVAEEQERLAMELAAQFDGESAT